MFKEMSINITTTENILEALYNYHIDYEIKELFNDIKYINIGDNYIGYSIEGEYGTSIYICEKSSEVIVRLLVDTDNNKNKIVTTFFCEKTKKGISENIFSNRTEYFIDGTYITTKQNEEIDKIIRNNTEMILGGKKYPTLYELIMNKNIKIIPKSEFNLNSF